MESKFCTVRETVSPLQRAPRSGKYADIPLTLFLPILKPNHEASPL
jgi:hypothetical protein